MACRLTGPALALGLLGATAPLAASAQTAPSLAGAPAQPLVAQSVRVVRDKATGKLRAPTHEEAQELEAAERASRKARGLPEVAAPAATVVRRRADGSLSAQLGPEYLVTLKAQRRADGTLRAYHDDPALTHPVPAPRPQLVTE